MKSLLELLGVSTPGFKIDFLKTTIWLHPQGLDNRARLILKIRLKYDKEKKDNADLENPKIQIYFMGKPGLMIENLYDENSKLNREYLTNIGSEYIVSKEEKEESTERIRIKNIPPNYIEKKSYKVANEGYIPIELEFNPFSEKKAGMLMISMILDGRIIEKEPIPKRLVGISRFAWRFQYRMWGHKEHTFPIVAENIGSCQQAQAYVVIPGKFFRSKGHLSLVPGGDQMHIINNSDIYTFTKFIYDEEKKKKDSKWMETGSCSISWSGARNILSISRDICIEHHEAFPRATTVFFLALFWLALALGIGIIWYKGENFLPYDLIVPGIGLLLSSIFVYFWINIRNYSFYEWSFPGIIRTLQSGFSILAACFGASTAFLSTTFHYRTQQWPSEILYLFFGISLITFVILSFRIESMAESKRIDLPERTVGPVGCIFLFLAITFSISFAFSWLFPKGETFFNNLLAFWMVNNFSSSLIPIINKGD